MFNFKKSTSTVKLEGCLDDSPKAVICGHGNHADSCYLCTKDREAKSKENRKDFFNDSSNFGSPLGRTLNLDD